MLNTKYHKIIPAILLAGLMIIPSFTAFALQGAPAPEPKPAEPSPYQEPMFYAMLVIAFILLVFIMQLSKLFSAVVQNFVKKNKTLIILIASGFAMMNPTDVFAAAQAAGDAAKEAEQVPFLHHGFGHKAYNILAVIIAIEIFVAMYYSYLIRSFLVKAKEAEPYVERKSKPFWDRFNKSVAVESEATIMTDHDYDGIRELDNSLPPWWKYGFYLTIVWSFVYLAHYHVFGTGELQLDEFASENARAEQEIAEYMKLAANAVDETNVVFLNSASDLAEGKALFAEKTCTTCHGGSGEGNNGPNLTDAYWLHGGSISDIFKTIKYGVPEKGMRSWKTDITPSQMAKISSYIMSLQGTNPPNGKPAQGVLYTPAAAAPADTLAAPADTLLNAAPDSLGK